MKNASNIPRTLSTRQLLVNWLCKHLLCPLGKHQDKLPDGSQGNFCGICRKQMVEQPYKQFKVLLKDGSEYSVTAINSVHAFNLAVYGEGPKKAIDGVIQGSMLIHSHNIKSITEIH